MKITRILTLALISICFSLVTVQAQRTVSGFVGPLAEFSSFDGSLIISAGGGGAVVLEEVFFLGAFGMGQVNMVPKTITLNEGQANEETYNEQDIALGQFGIWFGYISNPYNNVRWTGSMKVGFGGLSFMTTADEDLQNFQDNFTAFTPQFDLDLVATRFLKINAGIGYRLAFGANQNPFTNGQLSSPVGHIGLFFGGITE